MSSGNSSASGQVPARTPTQVTLDRNRGTTVGTPIACSAFPGKCPPGSQCTLSHAIQIRAPSASNRFQGAGFAPKRAVKSVPTTPACPRASTSRHNRAAVVRNDGQARQACRDWDQGRCPRGNRCTLKHELKDLPSGNDLVFDPANTLQTSIFGSTVTFVRGLEVAGIITGFQSSRVRVKNLPLDANLDDLSKFFTQQGVRASSFRILFLRPKGKVLQAEILVDSQAGCALVGLNGIKFRNKHLVCELVQKDDGATSEVSSDVLTVSWGAGTASFVVRCDSEGQARLKVQELNGRQCAGRKVKVERDKPPNVRVSGLPYNVDNATVIAFTGSPTVRRIPSRFACTDEQAHHFLRQTLDDLSGHDIQSHDIQPKRNDGTLSVRIRFSSWGKAKLGQKHLNEKRFPQMGNVPIRAHVPDPFSDTITIPADLYRVQKAQWSSLAQTAAKTKGACQCTLSIGEVRQVINIRVFGSDETAFRYLKVRVESLAAGKVLYRSLSGQDVEPFFARVANETKSLIRPDHHQRVIRVFGSPRSVALAVERIEAEAARLATLEKSQSIQRPAPPQTVRQNACPACSETPKVAVRLGCNHTYCEACLRHLLIAAADSTGFPIACMSISKGAPCLVGISISMIQQVLTDQAFDHLMEESLRSYLFLRKNEYKHCKTPKCMQIYRVAEGGHAIESMKCSSCSGAVCSACDEKGHLGMTCEERRIAADPSKQNRLVKAWMGVKKCPSCGAALRKFGGSDAASCRCGGHICWTCLGHIKTGNISEHMHTAHGPCEIDQQAIAQLDARRQQREATRAQANGRVMDEAQRIYEEDLRRSDAAGRQGRTMTLSALQGQAFERESRAMAFRVDLEAKHATKSAIHHDADKKEEDQWMREIMVTLENQRRERPETSTEAGDGCSIM